MLLRIFQDHHLYVAEVLDQRRLSAASLADLISLLSDAGEHSTDISDAIDAAGLSGLTRSRERHLLAVSNRRQ